MNNEQVPYWFQLILVSPIIGFLWVWVYGFYRIARSMFDEPKK